MASARPLALAVIGLAVAGVCRGASPETPAWRSRVAGAVLSAYDARESFRAGPSSPLRIDREGRIEVDIRYDCSGSAPELAAAGFSAGTLVELETVCVTEGWVAPAAVPRIAATRGVRRIEAPVYVIHRHPLGPPVGSAGTRQKTQTARPQAAPAQAAIDGTALTIMHADQFLAQTSVTGAGVTVGVQSTGVASLSVIQGRNELPQTVQVVGGASTADDEGTALLEVVHAVAPGAALAFCEPTTFTEYLSCLSELIGVGATILVDDVQFPPLDLMSTDSTDAQAIEQLLAQNPTVLLFTAAGNANGSYWEGNYTPVSVASAGLAALSCATGSGTRTDNYIETFDGSGTQHLTVSSSSGFPTAFAWADPFGQNASNFDLYWSNDADGTQNGCFSGALSSSTLLQPSLNLASGSYTLRIGTPDASLSGKFLKLWIGGDGLTSVSDPTAGSFVAPQEFAAGVITVGAVNGSDGIGNGIESFSSRGPLTVVFPAPQQIPAPTLVAPDGIRVDASGTYFLSYLWPDGNFYGTSASVPNAGAVAALLRSAFPQLTSAQVLTALQAGATALGAGAPNTTYGYGRVDALGALATLATPTITPLPDATLNAGSSSPPTAFTVGGTGNIHFSVTSSDATVIPAAIVASGAGVSITPADCGTTTMTCSLSITPAYGGASTVVLSALDGANRSASATMHITVNGAPPPSPTPTAVASHGGGGVLHGWEIGILLLLIARRRRRAQRPARRRS